MTDSLVRTLTDEDHRRASQLGVYKLACEHFWHAFDASLSDLAGKCEDLAHHYCPELWDQYKEGLVTSSEFLNKLLDEMATEGTQFMPPIDRLAAEALHARADRACRQFAKSVQPINEQLTNEAVRGSPLRPGSEPVAADSWRNRWTIGKSAYLFCHAIGSRLSSLDRANR